MKTFLMVFAVIFFAACNNATDADKTDDATALKTDSSAVTDDNVSYAYTADYSSKFEMGKPEYAASILKLWKSWDDGNLSAARDIFADSVTMVFSSGDKVAGKRDSIIAMGQKERDMFASAKSQVHAWTSLRSTDKNENWVNIWGREVDTDKKGKVDSSEIQETWRLNSDGKADLVYQYRAAIKPMKK